MVKEAVSQMIEEDRECMCICAENEEPLRNKKKNDENRQIMIMTTILINRKKNNVVARFY